MWNKFLAAAFILSLFSFTQTGFPQHLPAQQGLEPKPLTPEELFVLSHIPVLELPDRYKGTDAPLLPVSVDNSTQQYFRPITWQSGYECGQSAGVAFNFTYEIDRLRGLPANTGNNQYPTHFTWDFLNNANNYQGASFFDSWEIIRTCGNMNVTDYGGALNTGGYMRWISGYDKYYNGMKNRLNKVWAIRVDSPEGLQTLKYWLFEHLDGSSVGGVVNMYAKYYSSTPNVLPPGTPEAGKYVMTNWGSSPSHAWTICGYNDSIRFDFNGDGQFTNNLDINSDGVVNMRDWEKGGFKFANGYAGTGWCNGGFCYSMYKNFADDIAYGGIWNHSVFVIDVKQTCNPQLTMKVTVKHTSRNKLKVTAGINPDLSATVPSVVLEFPIFNFQGGDFYMQGGTTEDAKTIEFGLDLDPLLSYINPGQTIKYFFQITEKDPSGAAAGEVVNLALMDYTGSSAVAIPYTQTNVPIVNNGVTRLAINHSLNFSKPVINTATLPPSQLYHPYSQQLQAAGGASPYRWDVQFDYSENMQASSFPQASAQQLTLTHNNTGYAIKTLDFAFPFYNRSINKFYVYADGYILFDDQPYTYPYLIDKNLLFRQTAIIAPFMTDMTIYPSSGQGIWYEGNTNYAIFRWKASITGASGTTNLNFAVKVYATGDIEYYYGDMVCPVGTAWTGGISMGDNRNFQYSSLNNTTPVTPNIVDKFNSCGYPVEMTLSEEGLFSGIPTHPYTNLPIRFRVTDNNNISNTKVLLFNSYGLLMDYSIISGSDSLIEFGENAFITVTLMNMGNQSINNLVMTIEESDPYITLLDSTQTVPVLAAGQTVTIDNAFAFHTSHDVPDAHPFSLNLKIVAQEQSVERTINLMAWSPIFHVTHVSIDDGDNDRLDPGETTPLAITWQNQGGAKAQMVQITLNSLDTLLTFNSAMASVNCLLPDSSVTLNFNVTAGGNAPFEHVYDIETDILAANLSRSDSLFLFSGEIREDFETGNFSVFPWFASCNTFWFCDTVIPYEGNYCSRSIWMNHGDEACMNLVVNVIQDGELSFYRLVSCEQDPSGNINYDYLTFMIDNIEQVRWDGQKIWEKVTFPITQGYHTLTWKYHKDGSVSQGYDCAMIDNITFPLLKDGLPEIEAAPWMIDKFMQPDMIAYDTVYVQNTGGEKLEFHVLVYDTSTTDTEVFSDQMSGSFLECSETDFVPGQTYAWNLTLHNLSNDNEYIRDLKIDCPVDYQVSNSSNFSGGSLGELVFLGDTGSATTLTYHGSSSGNRGVIKPGETATAVISGKIPEAQDDDIFLVYNITGDSISMGPNNQAGHVRIENNGLSNGWITLIDPVGELLHDQTAAVIVKFSTAALPFGDHRAKIIVRDLYNNKVVIPVLLHITPAIGLPPGPEQITTGIIGCNPNPFTDNVVIRYQTDCVSQVKIYLLDLNGAIMAKLVDNVHTPGEYSLDFHGTGQSGNALPAGFYILRMTAGKYTGTCKLLLIR